MAPCRFFAQGNCRNGNNCRFEHILPGGGNQGSSNRFAPLQNQNNSRNDSRNNNAFNNRQGGVPSTRELPFLLDKDAIITDLTNERPQWILSAYGPGRFAPAQLFGGPRREQSFEEMRLIHYTAVAAGNPQGAIQQANDMYNSAEQQIQNALGNMDGAIDYIVKSQHEHPNRVDTVAQSAPSPPTGVFSKAASSSKPNPFGSAIQPTTNPFGASAQPSAFGAPPLSSAFGAPAQPSAFGAPSQPGAFGQPSALGSTTNPFGAPSTTAFGAPSQVGGTTSAFGQSSTLGQKPNPFGAPSGGSAFGQTSSTFGGHSGPVSGALGASSQSVSAFGAPSNLGARPNVFGQPSAPVNPFGSKQESTTVPNPFGQSSSNPSPFGAPSTLSQPGTFGTSTANPFGVTSQPAVPNPFGANPPVTSSFGALATAPVNPFGASTTKAPSTASPFTQVNGQVSGNYVPPTGGDLSTYTSKDMTGRLTTFKGRRVQYKENEPGYLSSDGTWCRIFFPEGPPSHTSQTTTDPVDQYDTTTEAAYRQLLETGSFPDGFIPLLPPKKEWLRWDF